MTPGAVAKDPALPAYLEYQSPTAMSPRLLVYVNYGNVDSYKRLEQFGISVKGKIVMAAMAKAGGS